MELDMNVFKEMCDSVDIRIGYADENRVSKWFNRAFLESGKRKEEDLDKPLKDCHLEKSYAKIEHMYKEFENGRRKRFEIKVEIDGEKTVIHYYPLFIEGVFKGVFETIFFPGKLMEGFPYPGEFSVFRSGQSS
jgi:DUF438 domain-containing protein